MASQRYLKQIRRLSDLFILSALSLTPLPSTADSAQLPLLEPPLVQPGTALEQQLAQLKVMSFNLKYASEDSSRPWSQRRPLIKNAILSQHPDLIGTQEGLYKQLRDIAADLPGYGWVGEGREGGHQGEFTAIFYRKDRLTVVESGRFWLSSTPEVTGSKTWGNWIPRMATWVRFRDKTSGSEFVHFNTHLDHINPYARIKSAQLIKQRIKHHARALPVVVTGDFNTAQDGRVHQTLAPRVARDGFRLVDSWDAAPTREGQNVATYHGWRGPRKSDLRIDWILASPELKCRRSAVVLYQENGQWPSDHFPIMSTLELPALKTAPVLVAEGEGSGVEGLGARVR